MESQIISARISEGGLEAMSYRVRDEALIRNNEVGSDASNMKTNVQSIWALVVTVRGSNRQ